MYKSSNSSDSGAIARAFGLVLEFLNDNDNGVFVVMTSNDVSQLPPELTRAGRLDATWYFSLPTLEERKQIFRIHLNNINRLVSEDVIEAIAEETDRYTGAEIELIVKSAFRIAFLNKIKTNEDKGITLEILQQAVKDVVPISSSYKEQILSLERWARNRALFANGEEIKEQNKKISGNFIKPLRGV